MTQQYAGAVTAVSSDGRFVAIANYDAAAPDDTQNPLTIVYDTRTEQRLITVYGQITSLSPDGTMACLCDGINTIRIYECATGKVIKEFSGIYAKFTGELLLVGLNPTEGEVYSASNWELIHKSSMKLTEKTIDSLTSPFMPNASRLLARAPGKQLIAYDLPTGFILWRGSGVDGYFSDDGSKICIDSITTKCPTVDIYAIETGKQLCQILGFSALFSPDTRSIAAAKYDEQENKTTIYDIATGSPQHTYKGEILQFSPDGTKTIMIVEGDGKDACDSVHVFDLGSERTLQKFDILTEVDFLPNGSLCIHRDNTTQIAPQTP